MRGKPRALVAAVGAALLLGFLTVTTYGSSVAHARTYTLAAVRALVAKDPSGWLGRPVRVRAAPALQWCFAWVLPANGTCRLAEPALVATEPDDWGEPLPLGWGDASPLLTLLRRTPVLSAFAPRPQALSWGIPGVYSIELKEVSCVSGQTGRCYQAVVLDPVEW
jgi:hypothetical protein